MDNRHLITRFHTHTLPNHVECSIPLPSPRGYRWSVSLYIGLCVQRGRRRRADGTLRLDACPAQVSALGQVSTRAETGAVRGAVLCTIRCCTRLVSLSATSRTHSFEYTVLQGFLPLICERNVPFITHTYTHTHTHTHTHTGASRQPGCSTRRFQKYGLLQHYW